MWFAKLVRWSIMVWAVFCVVVGLAVYLRGDTGELIDLHEFVAAVSIFIGFGSALVSELIAAFIRAAIHRRRIPVARVVRTA